MAAAIARSAPRARDAAAMTVVPGKTGTICSAKPFSTSVEMNSAGASAAAWPSAALSAVVTRLTAAGRVRSFTITVSVAFSCADRKAGAPASEGGAPPPPPRRTGAAVCLCSLAFSLARSFFTSVTAIMILQSSYEANARVGVGRRGTFIRSFEG
jgi:hypothetical protein